MISFIQPQKKTMMNSTTCFIAKVLTAKVLLAISLLPQFAASASAQDRVQPLKGAAISGVINEIDRDKVVIEVRGTPQNIPVTEISKIIFEDEPRSMERARDLTRQSQHEQAKDELQKVDASSIKNDNVKSDLAFLLAYNDGKLALAGKGDKSAAVKALVAYDKDNPNGYHYWETSQLLGQLAGSMARYDNALTFFKRLGESTYPEIKNEGKYQEGITLSMQGKTAEAKAVFEQIQAAAASSAKDIRIKQLAEVGLAQCQLSEGDAQGALTKINESISKGDSTDIELFGKLYNTQGACYQKLNKTNEAVLAYLHTDLLFSGDAGNHAEALYYLSQLWPTLNETQRATDARSRLSTNYAGSVWVNKK